MRSKYIDIFLYESSRFSPLFLTGTEAGKITVDDNALVQVGRYCRRLIIGKSRYICRDISIVAVIASLEPY